MADGSKPVVRRSRAGCAECRRRRRRCDEKKPTCGYCQSTEQECKYVVKLSWGGRPFSRSIFGQCMGDDEDGVAKIATPAQSTSRQPFVYGTTRQKKEPKSSLSGGAFFVSNPETVTATSPEHGLITIEQINPAYFVKNDGSIPSTAISGLTSSTKFRVRRLEPYRNPTNYAWIPSQYRELLDYFTEKMTRSISCYDVVQKEYCSNLLPMAMGSPHLLAAVLYLSACHRTSRGLDQDPKQTEHLRTSSLQQLRLSITKADAIRNIETAVASTLTLCIADIVSEIAQPGSWRIHLQGALSLWSQMINDPSFPSRANNSTTKFLKRWYISFETIAFGCGIVPVRGFMSQVEGEAVPEEEYIDDITSFSTALLPVFEEINNLKLQTAGRHTSVASTESEEDLAGLDAAQDTCQILISSVHQLLATRTLKFRSDVADSIPERVKLDYFTLDEAYHHMALLQIYTCSVRPIPAEIVRASVIQVITSVSRLTFIDNPCPAVAVLPPLFVAGSQAWELVDQQKIVDILDNMEACWGMGNVRTSRALLDKIWKAQAIREDEKGPFHWEIATGEKWDILPY